MTEDASTPLIHQAWQPRALSLLRFVAGLLFFEHGLSKLMGFPPAPQFAHLQPLSLLGAAGLIELVGGALVCVGLFTRVSAFIMSGEMAVGYFLAHAPHSPFPVLNGGDAAVLYCFIFFYLFVAGGGSWSLDRLRADHQHGSSTTRSAFRA
jgi:putative oxidoreductase